MSGRAELGDGLTLMFETPQLTNWSGWGEETAADDEHFLRTVRRGHAEGSIDPELDEECRNLVWALLCSAWEHTRSAGASKHSAMTLGLHTLRKAIAP